MIDALEMAEADRLAQLEYAKDKGLEKGQILERIATIKTMIEIGMPLEQIASIYSMSSDEILEYIQQEFDDD